VRGARGWPVSLAKPPNARLGGGGGIHDARHAVPARCASHCDRR
jgi:hypothetical protein